MWYTLTIGCLIEHAYNETNSIHLPQWNWSETKAKWKNVFREQKKKTREGEIVKERIKNVRERERRIIWIKES